MMNSPNPARRKDLIQAVLLSALLALLAATPGSGYTLIRVQDFVAPPAHWIVAGLPLPTLINSAGSGDVPGDSDIAAITAGEDAWTRISTDYFAFAAPTVGVGTALDSDDGKNSIFFDEAGTNFPDGTSAIAFTVVSLDGATGVMIDADLVFNGLLTFSTATPTPVEAFDIQGIATHELGHVTGIDHTGIVSAVMYPIGADGQQFQRNLGPDDRLGDSYLYPEASGGAGITGLQAGDGDLSLAAGTISGSVRTSGGIAVPGAHVVALDPTGAAVVGDVSRPDGSYLLTGLYPGTYTVYAEPLDGVTIEQDLSQAEFMNSFYPFVTTFLGGNASPSNVTVIAGSNSAANDIDLGSLFSVETEANNTYGAANPVALEALTSGIINPAGDVDYFAFAGTSGDFINIDVDASGDGYPLDPYISLFSTDGTTLVAPAGILVGNPNDDFLGKGNDSRIVRRLAATGTFYLRVEDFTNLAGDPPPAGGAGFFYTAHVNKAIPEVEPNTPYTSANQASIGQYRGGIITSTSDIDYYKFTLRFGDRIQAEVTAKRAGSPLNPALTLYGADGTTVLASNLDIDNAGGNYDALIDYTCINACLSGPITVYLRVSAQSLLAGTAFYVLHLGTDFLNPMYSAVNTLYQGLGGVWYADIFPRFVPQGSSFDLIVAGTGIPNDPDLSMSVSGPGVSLAYTPGADYGGNTSGYDFFAMSTTVSGSAPPGPRTIFIQNATLKAALSGMFVITPTSVPPEAAPVAAPLAWSGAQMSWAADPSVSFYNVYRGALPLADLDLNGVADSYGSPFACGLTAPLCADPEVPAPGGGFSYLVTGKNSNGEGTLGFTRNDAGGGVERPKSALTATCP